MLDRTTRSKFQMNLIISAVKEGKTETKPVNLWSSEVKKWKKKGFTVIILDILEFKKSRKSDCIISWDKPTKSLAQKCYEFSCDNNTGK